VSIAVENATCACRKVVFVSRREALKQAKRASSYRNPTKAQLRPYRCEKGFWHLTSRPAIAKTRRIQFADDRVAAKAQRKVAKQRRAVQQLRVMPVPPAPRPQPRPTGPEHTSCVTCGRRWLSDLSPVGRRCPGCGSIGTVLIGWADRARDYIREVAA
jgi:predicted RNA-binding Zn-ribbon protein involved in translation (DUF1610 family)